MSLDRYLDDNLCRQIGPCSKYETEESLQPGRPRFNEPSPVLGRFSLLPGAVPGAVFSKMTGPHALDLTVGEWGVVGRPVYIVDDHGRSLGRGIIGWN